MTQTIPGYYSLAQAAAHLGISKSVTSRVAKLQIPPWPIFKAGNAHCYRAEDIHEYRAHQLRTQLAKALGWRGRGLYRVDDIDIACPICDAFAIEWPATPKLSDRYLCVNDHEGSI
jgi:hypothetical protein